MISIVIPVYNQAKKLRECLQSILEQSEKDVEVVIVNDGSTDNISDVVAGMKSKFQERGIRLVFKSQQNKGANAARNAGAEEARGEFIIFCDADIVMIPDMLEKMKKKLEDDPQASYAYSSFLWGRKLFRLWDFDAVKLRQVPYITTTTLIRRERFPGFDENLKRLQDWDLWLTMLEQGYTGTWVDEVLFRVKTGGTMSSWLPAFAYKLFPFLPQVKKYKKAVETIKEKHKLK